MLAQDVPLKGPRGAVVEFEHSGVEGEHILDPPCRTASRRFGLRSAPCMGQALCPSGCDEPLLTAAAESQADVMFHGRISLHQGRLARRHDHDAGGAEPPAIAAGWACRFGFDSSLDRCACSAAACRARTSQPGAHARRQACLHRHGRPRSSTLRPPLRAGSLICSQISAIVLPAHAIEAGVPLPDARHAAGLEVPRRRGQWSIASPGCRDCPRHARPAAVRTALRRSGAAGRRPDDSSCNADASAPCRARLKWGLIFSRCR